MSSDEIGTLQISVVISSFYRKMNDLQSTYRKKFPVSGDMYKLTLSNFHFDFDSVILLKEANHSFSMPWKRNRTIGSLSKKIIFLRLYLHNNLLLKQIKFMHDPRFERVFSTIVLLWQLIVLFFHRIFSFFIRYSKKKNCSVGSWALT